MVTDSSPAGWGPAWAGSPAAYQLREQIKILIASSCPVTIVEANSLVRSSGKLKRVYDLSPKSGTV